MPDRKILISVVTPVYNRAFCVKRVIDSVKSAVLPADFDYEHIIVDDGSTDKSVAVVQNNKYDKLFLITSEKNGGVNAARNEGIKKSKGDYILFLDSDDEITSQAFVEIKKALEKTKFQHKVYKFQTRHASTKKLMSKINYPYKKITYAMRLQGGFLQGEFISLVHKSVFKKIMFDKDRMAFELFFWNKVSKEFQDEVGIPSIIRIYHDEHEGRLSKQLLSSKHYAKRYDDYKLYLETFESDYLSFQLLKQLSKLYLTTGLYAILSSKKKISQKLFNKSLKYHFNCLALCSLLLSYFGKLPFNLAMNVYRRLTL